MVNGKFLYIEDHKDSCDMVRAALRGAEVVWAPNAKAALDLIEKDGSFSLYLIDHYLPDSTGLALCQRIRSHDDFTPAVFVSASQTLSIHDVREAGGHGLVRKASPNFFEQLRQTVADLAAANN